MTTRRKIIIGVLLLILIPCGCLMGWAAWDVTLRKIGILPTYTPEPTSTNTNTPTITSTPTDTPTVTNSPIPRNTPLPSDTPIPTATRVIIPTNTRAINSPTPEINNQPDVVASGFNLVSIAQRVVVGDNARAEILTVPGADCRLTYTTPKGTESQAQGLGRKTADAFGRCSWVWKIGTNTSPGTGKITITGDDMSQSYDIEIVDR